MPELDSVRGIAILMVLFYHGFASRYGTAGMSGLPKFLVSLTGPGWTGVNLFFALSGFLITGILLDSKEETSYYRRFYFRRALRILPAYYALLLLLLAGGTYVANGDSVSWKFLGLSTLYLANVTVFFGVPMQFGVLWSLAVEEHFYLVWPVIVRNLSRSAVCVSASLIAVAATIARVVASRLGFDCFGHYTWLVADGLAFGALLAAFVRGRMGTRKGLLLISLATVVMALALVGIDAPFRRPLFGGALHVTALNLLCTGAVSLTLFVGTGSWRLLMHQKALRFFGDISYGLYLVHLVLFNVFDNLWRRLLPGMPSFKGHFEAMLLRFVVAGSAAVLVATISRWYFEEPFLRLKDRLDSTSKRGTQPSQGRDPVGSGPSDVSCADGVYQ